MARVALVTGGTRGIGAAISKALKDAGYTVAANYGGNDEAAQKFKAGTGIPVYKFDVSDAAACAEALGVRYDSISIAPAVEGFEEALAPLFAGRPRDITEENLQSRARGTILMSVSTKFGPLVVTTGNKSEMSVGYATLSGDMTGGFNPITDLYKMEVYRLSALRNRWKPNGALGPDGLVIPENIIA